MKQYTQKDFIRILTDNDYKLSRYSGDHAIFIKEGRHISVPHNLNACIARRLIIENTLELPTNKKMRRANKSMYNAPPENIEENLWKNQENLQIQNCQQLPDMR